MEALPKPEVIITHESDLDGFVSGLLLQRLAKHLFGLDVRLEAYHYNNWKLRELREKSAWICDINYESRMDKANWLIVDHHATESRPAQAQMIHDIGKSAGLLAYDLCKECGLGSPELDRLVGLLNPGGLLVVLTALWTPERDFRKWPYANDETHIAFYSGATFDFMAATRGLYVVETNGKDLVVAVRR